MKNSNLTLKTFLLIIFISAIYRVLPGRIYGFDPQIAICLFAGSLFIKNKKVAFILPIICLFISDLLYFGLHKMGLSSMNGFYDGQWLNYLLMIPLCIFGFLLNLQKIKRSIFAILAAPTFYFLTSNFFVWLGNGGYQRPKTWAGLMQCLIDGVPFYKYSIISTIIFSMIIFGIYFINYKPKLISNSI